MKELGTVAKFLFLALIFVTSCSPKVSPVLTPAASPYTTTSDSSAKASWEKEWGKVLEGARKEGKVMIYSTAPGIWSRSIGPAFKEKFGITLESITARGAEIAARLIAEHKARINIADVYVGGSGTAIRQIKPSSILEPLEPLLMLPEVLDQKAWFGGDLLWVDAQKTILSFLAYASNPVVINSKSVRPEEIKSFYDLLQPKWKGKIVINDPTLAGPGSMSFRVYGFRIFNLDFFRELAKMEPVVIRDQRLQVEWVAQGKYSIAVAPDSIIVKEFKEAGSPLEYIMPAEGSYLSAGHGNISLINQAPHKNSAQVFINWILSREGSTVFSRAIGSQSARVDVSSDFIDASLRRQPGVKYWIGAHTEEFQLKEPEMMKDAREIFGPLIK